MRVSLRTGFARFTNQEFVRCRGHSRDNSRRLFRFGRLICCSLSAILLADL